MNNHEFFNEFISPVSHKIKHDQAEHQLLTGRADVVLVKATTLYQIYRHNVFDIDGRLPLKEFYRVCGQYLYYDKYVCRHGTEFYYYIVFNEDNSIFNATKELVLRRVELNSPSTLDDLKYIIGREGVQ